MIKDKIDDIKKGLPGGVRLIAVSKTKPVEMLQEAYDAGQRLFGENYATELRDKHEVMPKDIEWHFIGHLQAKQLKYYIDFVSMIHGVDSMEHLEAVEKAAAKAGRTVDVLLQFHIAQEETKFGFTIDENKSLAESAEKEDKSLAENAEKWKMDNGEWNYPHVRICGVMGMATQTDDEEQVRREFRRLKQIFDMLKRDCFADSDCFKEISMGMSHDYQIAVEEGATLIRLGSSIFGPRDYSKLRIERL